jgi:hypothetical protein
MASSPLAGWDNFYVIAGSAAAGLTGLTFVVIALASMPNHGQLSLSLGFGACGVAGLIYVGRIAASMHGLSAYDPAHGDWLWNVALPAIVYGTLLAIAFFIWDWPHQCMYGVAAAVVLLMIIGIHNAWDIAVWNSLRKERDPP